MKRNRRSPRVRICDASAVRIGLYMLSLALAVILALAMEARAASSHDESTPPEGLSPDVALQP